VVPHQPRQGSPPIILAALVAGRQAGRQFTPPYQLVIPAEGFSLPFQGPEKYIFDSYLKKRWKINKTSERKLYSISFISNIIL